MSSNIKDDIASFPEFRDDLPGKKAASFHTELTQIDTLKYYISKTEIPTRAGAVPITIPAHLIEFTGTSPKGNSQYALIGTPLGLVKLQGKLDGLYEKGIFLITGWYRSAIGNQSLTIHHYEAIDQSDRKEMSEAIARLYPNIISSYQAEVIAREFKAESLSILQNEPEKIASLFRDDKESVSKMIDALKRVNTLKQISTWLNKQSTTRLTAEQLYEEYGEKSLDILYRNPYQLIYDFSGIGFRVADKWALNVGVPADSMFRMKAAIEFTLANNDDSGSTCITQGELINATLQYALGYEVKENTSGNPQTDNISERLKEALEEEVKDERIIYEDGFYSLWSNYIYEVTIASRLHDIICGKKTNVSFSIRELEAQEPFSFTQDQKNALSCAFTEKVCCIPGEAGTGKTTIVNTLIKNFESRGLSCCVVTPTAKAAIVAREKTNHDASTIHSRIGLTKYNGSDTDFEDLKKIDDDVVIIDEVSMVDTYTMAALLSCVKDDARVIFVGDIRQLPSVGAGACFRDIIESGYIESRHMHQVVRQGDASPIVTNAHGILHGKTPSMKSETATGRFYVQTVDEKTLISAEKDNQGKVLGVLPYKWVKSKDLTPEQKEKRREYREMQRKLIQDKVLRTVAKLRNLEGYSDDDIVVLCPQKTENDILGTRNLNPLLQNLFNPAIEGQEIFRQVKGSAVIDLKVGDRVVFRKNNYKLGMLNGMTGVIVGINSNDPGADIAIKVKCDDRIIDVPRTMMGDVDLGYARTVHTAQGSEYKAVVMAIAMNQSNSVLDVSCLYTAFTRATQCFVMFVDDKYTLDRAINTNNANQRSTGLIKKIRDFMKPELDLSRKALERRARLIEKNSKEQLRYDMKSREPKEAKRHK